MSISVSIVNSSLVYLVSSIHLQSVLCLFPIYRHFISNLSYVSFLQSIFSSIHLQSVLRIFKSSFILYLFNFTFNLSSVYLLSFLNSSFIWFLSLVFIFKSSLSSIFSSYIYPLSLLSIFGLFNLSLAHQFIFSLSPLFSFTLFLLSLLFTLQLGSVYLQSISNLSSLSDTQKITKK